MLFNTLWGLPFCFLIVNSLTHFMSPQPSVLHTLTLHVQHYFGFTQYLINTTESFGAVAPVIVARDWVNPYVGVVVLSALFGMSMLELNPSPKVYISFTASAIVILEIIALSTNGAFFQWW